MPEERRCTLIVHDEHDGMLWANVAELPGCIASGADRAELREAAEEAIRLCLGDPDAGLDIEERAAP